MEKPKRKAEIIEVVPNRKGDSPYTYKPGYAKVKDENGKVSIHVTGSLNGISPKYRKVGQKGCIQYRKFSHGALDFFEPIKETA